jgi:hypothetical protein
MTTATIQGIKSIPSIPRKGEHYLSVNLAIVDPAEVWEIAKALGFKPQLVQITNRFGIEIHALLFFEQREGEPLGWTDLDNKIDELADRIDTRAIRHVYGGRLVA